MKLTQDNLIKLGLGAAGGYVIADFLIPKRGFAAPKCGNPNSCYIGGSINKSISCCNIPEQYVDVCQGDCMKGQGRSDPWNDPSWIQRHEQRRVQEYPEGVQPVAQRNLIEPINEINRGGGGGGGGGIGGILGGLPGTIFGIATPIVLIGGFVALIVLTRR